MAKVDYGPWPVTYDDKGTMKMEFPSLHIHICEPPVRVLFLNIEELNMFQKWITPLIGHYYDDARETDDSNRTSDS